MGIASSSGRLKEDGVYGKETQTAWNEFAKTLVSGSVPTLGFINPLQTKITGYELRTHSVKTPSNFIKTNYPNILEQYPVGFSAIHDLNSTANDTSIFRFDLPHANKQFGTSPYSYHMNIDSTIETNLPKLVSKYFYNHKEISEETYWKLKNFQSKGKIFRCAGKVLLVSGAVLDVLEIARELQLDYSADRKLGKQSTEALAVVSGRWVGGGIGAKLGAMAGATAGSVVPGLGTAIGGIAGGLVGGIAGSFGGEKLAAYIVDITALED